MISLHATVTIPHWILGGVTHLIFNLLENCKNIMQTASIIILRMWDIIEKYGNIISISNGSLNLWK